MAFPMVPVDPLTVPGLPVLPVEVGPVAVLIPPSTLVGHGTVGDCNIIVSVLSGERTSLVIAEGVSCSAIVTSYADLVQASAVLHSELVIVGKDCFLSIPHIHTQLIAALGCYPVDVV